MNLKLKLKGKKDWGINHYVDDVQGANHRHHNMKLHYRSLHYFYGFFSSFFTFFFKLKDN